jgi:hypothetical protein
MPSSSVAGANKVAESFLVHHCSRLGSTPLLERQALPFHEFHTVRLAWAHNTRLQQLSPLLPSANNSYGDKGFQDFYDYLITTVSSFRHDLRL